jgi:hypothetical protein
MRDDEESQEAACCADKAHYDEWRSLLNLVGVEGDGEGYYHGENVDWDGEELRVCGGVAESENNAGHGIGKSVDTNTVSVKDDNHGPNLPLAEGMLNVGESNPIVICDFSGSRSSLEFQSGYHKFAFLWG